MYDFMADTMKKETAILLLGLGVVIMASTGKTVVDNVITRMAAAIKSFEGWSVGSRSYRNNNPGNLKAAGQAGVTGSDDQGHAIFASYQAGWDALVNQLTLAFTGRSHVYTPDDSLYDFFGKYAEGNSTQYAEYVAAELGVSPNSTLAQIGGMA